MKEFKKFSASVLSLCLLHSSVLPAWANIKPGNLGGRALNGPVSFPQASAGSSALRVRAFQALLKIPDLTPKKLRVLADLSPKTPWQSELKAAAQESLRHLEEGEKGSSERTSGEPGGEGRLLERLARQVEEGNIPEDLSRFYDGSAASSKEGVRAEGAARSAGRWKASLPSEPAPEEKGGRDVLEEFLVKNKVPEEKREDVRKSLGEIWKVLSGLGTALGGEEDIRFRVGTWWSADPKTKTIYIPIGEVLEHLDNLPAMIGGISHEAGHIFYTRFMHIPMYEELLRRTGTPAAAHGLFNVLEDMFQEASKSKRWAGIGGYLKKMHELYRPDFFGGELTLPEGLRGGSQDSAEAQKEIKRTFPHEEYLEAVRSYWTTRAFPDSKSMVSPEVAQALEKTKGSVEKLLEMMPDQITPTEKEKLRDSYQRMKHIEKEILPHYLKLVEKSRENLKKKMKDSRDQGKDKGPENRQNGQGQGEEKQNQGGGGLDRPDRSQEKEDKNSGKRKKEQNPKEDGKGKKPSERGAGRKEGSPDRSAEQEDEDSKRAKEIIEDRAGRISKKQCPTHGKDSGEKGVQNKENSIPLNPEEHSKNRVENPQKGPPVKNNGPVKPLEVVKRLIEQHEKVLGMTHPSTLYEEILTKAAPLIDGLSGRLENIFQKNEKPGWEGHFKSGPRIDLKKWMRSEAKGWRNPGDFRVFKRKKLPTQRDYKFTLLVDLSGSMSGSGIRHALEMIVLFVEVLEGLGIDFSVLGFADKVHAFKNFSGGSSPSPLTPEEKNDLAAGISKAVGGYTWDTEAVYTALKGDQEQKIAGLADQPGERKVLIVATDGDGNGAASAKMDQVLAWAARKGIEVVGMGIGAGMDYVAKRYSRHILEPSLEEASGKVGDVLEEEIEAGFEEDASREEWEDELE